MGRVNLNKGRALEVALRAIDMQSKGIFPFNQPDIYPDTLVPEGISEGSLDHSQFIIHGCSIDKRRRATEVYKAIRHVFSELGVNFHNAPEAELVRILENHFGDAEDKPAEVLMANSRKLSREYGGDPRKTKVEGNIKQTIKNLRQFKEFGPGKAALVMKNYVRFGMWDFPEHEIPIKIDRHVLRICFGTGIIGENPFLEIRDWKNYTAKALLSAREYMVRQGHYTQEQFDSGEAYAVRADRLVIPLQEMFQEVCSEGEISAVNLNDAIYAIGANLCGRNNYLSCMTHCNIGCKTRPPSDNGAVYFFPEVDKRKNLTGTLFDRK